MIYNAYVAKLFTNKFDLTNEQKRCIEELVKWANKPDKKKYITLGGYAGTGKTTLISELSKRLHKKFPKVEIAFCAFTGKAATVLEDKLFQAGTQKMQDTVGTIHSLIYSPLLNSHEEIIGWDKKESIDAKLIIIDEASMVDESIWLDLLSYGIPIIAVGDHGQLPPINGKFNLMDNPEMRLEEIHRQAKENPIIQVSIDARTKGKIAYGEYGKGIKKLKRNSVEAQDIIENLLSGYTTDTMVLCGYNNTRIKLNQYIRQMLQFESPKPQSGDRVICLRNNRTENIFNGMLGSINYLEEPKDNSKWYFAEIDMDGRMDPFEGLIFKEQFNNPQSLNFTNRRRELSQGDLFDFGYAITVHKAQGSQAKRVILFEERFSKMDDEEWRRWLYTGVTRAEEELYIIG